MPAHLFKLTVVLPLLGINCLRGEVKFSLWSPICQYISTYVQAVSYLETILKLSQVNMNQIEATLRRPSGKVVANRSGCGEIRP